jgi:hypothetical protein
MAEVMTEQHTAFYLSLVLVILNTVEERQVPKSARQNRLKSVNQEVTRAVNFFRPEGWGKEDLDKACLVIDRCDELVKQFYPAIEVDV